MKFAAILLVCLVAATAAYTVPEEDNHKVVFSESAKLKLREAADNMVKTLCGDGSVEPEIMNTICLRAFYSSMGRTAQSDSQRAGNCMDCEVADPICWDACPQ